MKKQGKLVPNCIPINFTSSGCIANQTTTHFKQEATQSLKSSFPLAKLIKSVPPIHVQELMSPPLSGTTYIYFANGLKYNVNIGIHFYPFL